MLSSGATFDKTRKYRYRLWREWDTDLPRSVFLMLNPSQADAETNDPTIRACISLASQLGFGRLEVVNLFAYRSTDPKFLALARRPVGKENDKHILQACSEADAIVLAWGNHGSIHERGDEVRRLLSVDPERANLFCLGLTKMGHPRHPLYVKRTTKLVPLSLAY